MTAIVWFRRDLRLTDNPALCAALDAGAGVIPVFVLDDRLLHGRHASAGRTRFMLQALADLDQGLRERGSGLVVRHGDPGRELAQLAAQAGADTVHAAVDASGFARGRDRRVRAALAEQGVAVRGHPGTFVIDQIDLPGERTQTVFTPFHRRWLNAARRRPAATPRELPALPTAIHAGELPSLRALGIREGTLPPDPAHGGESAARERMDAFLREDVEAYGEGRNELAADRSSRLSPYLHFGCLSPRELERRLPDSPGGEAFRRQLAWRDFYGHVLRAHPQNARHEFQERYRATLAWSDDAETLDAWRAGRTGYPLVDAGMRQLLAEGWMHNRARLVVGSFLTKHLGIDWRLGERHFMAHLLDGDEASNNGNWQWIASVGVDPQPVFKRILSPTRQLERFDPDGAYVRRYVPELAGVPAERLAEPWRMSEAEQRRVGCVIGRDYPAPVVDHAAARQAALARYTEASRTTEVSP
jgi:deoxyribodipyrimidine photo-lyase